MSAILPPSEEEMYLLSILGTPDGLDLAEFCWHDSESTDGCYRAWDFQWKWYTCQDTYQVDQGGRALGKTVGITMRAFAFPFNYPGQKMLLTAPELNHLAPLTSAIEERLRSSRLVREMMPTGRSNGINKNPHWEARFNNGTLLISRLPNKDGKGVKGQHVLQIELDEAQDYPLAGWIEIVSTLNAWLPDAGWRCHGVPKGVRDKFFEITEGQKSASEENKENWTVHRPMAMNRPNWNQKERDSNISRFGGSRASIDYKRNIYGQHGDATNSVFVLARLMDCVDTDEASTYNSEVYTCIKVLFERLPQGEGVTQEERQLQLANLLDVPGTHRTGYSQRSGNREVGSPKGWSAFYAGMDVGVTNHPSEILVFGQRTGTDILELVLRVQLQRINQDDQMYVVRWIFDTYGEKLKAFAIDRTGVGFFLNDTLSRDPKIGKRIHGYNFSEKVCVGFEDRELERGEKQEDLAIMRNIVEATTDWLRSDYVDTKRMRLPYDREVLLEFQGQTYTVIKDTGNPYGTKRKFGGGSFHSLDAAKMMIGGKILPGIDETLKRQTAPDEILDVFLGADFGMGGGFDNEGIFG